ncbi:PQQ-dependent dehydrogenase, methanol/ethanol family [Haliea sp. E17]|uniref:PQQ-dependent dehydrogenase, methanol/ethanol family n=1 Tax=Haliea sp. E17 TaxID=3401576 RepID=UPI003AAEC603
MHNRIHHTLPAFALLAISLALGGCSRETGTGPATATAIVETPALPAIAADTPTDWPSWGRTGAETHYSPLAQVNRENVAALAPDWYFDLPPGNTMTAPVMADGKLFVTSGHSYIRALDATSGRLLWEYDSKSRELSGPRLRFGYGAKGLAYWNQRIFIVTHEGRVIALDANTGKPLWEARTLPEAPDGRYVNGAPRVFDGKLVIGHGGADTAPVRGYVDCFDAMSGEKLWRFYTIPGDPAQGFEQPAMAMAAKTWGGDWWNHGGGGTVWNAISYDPELKQFYLGTGNGFPYSHRLRSDSEGDNLFLTSVVAVDADTGEYRWHYQNSPAEQTDYNSAMDMTLATLEIDGEPRKVLMQAPKNGFFYVIDRTNGKLISAEPFSKVTWATGVDLASGRPIEAPGFRETDKQPFELWPGVTGAHSWQPQSFSPRTGLVYIPELRRASMIHHPGPDTPAQEVSMGIHGDMNLAIPGARTSFLKAWDPVKQEARWSVQTPGDWPGGTLATAGDLVFQGTIDGRFIAYDAATGEVDWSFNVGVPVVAPPVSYAVDGKQYIAVLTGNGTSGGGLFSDGIENFRTDYRMPRRVLVFSLTGTAQLPPNPPMPALVAPEDPDYQSDPTLEQQGAVQYMMAGCMVCHGSNAVPGGTAPDLRISPIVRSRDIFHRVVRGGALVPNGMPQFDNLDESQAESIRQYLRSLGQALDAPANTTDNKDNGEKLSMSMEQQKAIVSDFLNKLGALEIDQAGVHVAEDAVMHFPYLPGDNQFEGKTAILDQFKKTLPAFWEYMEFIPKAWYPGADGEVMIAEFSSRAVQKGNAGTYANEYIAVFRFRGDKLVLIREYFNPSLLQIDA